MKQSKSHWDVIRVSMREERKLECSKRLLGFRVARLPRMNFSDAKLWSVTATRSTCKGNVWQTKSWELFCQSFYLLWKRYHLFGPLSRPLLGPKSSPEPQRLGEHSMILIIFKFLDNVTLCNHGTVWHQSPTCSHGLDQGQGTLEKHVKLFGKRSGDKPGNDRKWQGARFSC